ncbi:MAG TPA: 2-amino-4-hydroxy-6-hydroxymethyldihydropteridine diphosphokinase [Candidatus Omnitrophota bacterium]|nr:2-amino-4-hydroxy-6-hydroxymethyldihydropteridine diphosphokinase [Candidatus Omnitrophota bacterium]
MGVYLGLGSNLGNRQENLTKAIALLKEKGITVLAHSSVIETDPVGGPPQGKYLNAVIQISTHLSANELLSVCQSVEKQMGRVKTVPNGPRTIDIDILLYDNVVLTSASLTIPHPRMFERAFVMMPLKEIAPHISKEHFYANH